MSLPETFVPGFHNEEAVRKMKYTKFGETGMSVSAISLGTGGFSYLYGWDEYLDKYLNIFNFSLLFQFLPNI